MRPKVGFTGQQGDKGCVCTSVCDGDGAETRGDKRGTGRVFVSYRVQSNQEGRKENGYRGDLRQRY